MSSIRNIFFASLFFLAACDTASRIEDPEKSYFLKYYGTEGDQTGDDLIVLPDGNLILFGTTKPSAANSTSQWYLVKAAPNGSVLWEKKFGGPFNDEARDIELTTNNELLLVGNTYKSATDRDI